MGDESASDCFSIAKKAVERNILKAGGYNSTSERKPGEDRQTDRPSDRQSLDTDRRQRQTDFRETERVQTNRQSFDRQTVFSQRRTAYRQPVHQCWPPAPSTPSCPPCSVQDAGSCPPSVQLVSCPPVPLSLSLSLSVSLSLSLSISVSLLVLHLF